MRSGLLLCVLGFASLIIATEAKADWIIRERFTNYDFNEKDNYPTNQEQPNFSSGTTVELDATYFFDKPFAIELSGTALKQDADSDINGTKMGDVWIVPANLVAQYHFFADQPFKVYVGLGMNYTWFTKSSSTNGYSIHYENTLGPVAQIGGDFQITKNWLINVDLKKIYMRPKFSVDGGPNLQDRIDPWVFGAGVGYRF